VDTRSKPAGAATSAWLPLLAAVMVIGGGCRSPEGGSEPRETPRPVMGEADPIDLEERYVVGPEAARALEYRIDWQIDALPPGHQGLRSVSLQGDSLLVLDRRNYLSRYRRDDGKRLWRIPVADEWEEILGINFMPEADRIFLTTGGSMLELDALTGSTLRRQRLEKVANTEPVTAGAYLVYGARNGQVIWHAPGIAYLWRAYQVAQSIRMKPVLYENVLLCVGTDGNVMALDVGSASQLWSRRLLDAVVARPIGGLGAFFLAGTDQYLYCFDAFAGRTLWSRLTTSPLTAAPTLVGERLYQQIPGEGLACFAAMPLDDPDGEVLWTAKSVAGNVLTSRREHLLAWDEEAREIAVLEPRGGGVVRVVEVPEARGLLTTSTQDGAIYVIGEDGRVERLVPR
jgi:outer membrane protein assembly factor BamB